MSENQRCHFSGTKDVAYGAEGKFYFKYGVTGGIDCNNSTFGDPTYGVVKACYTRDSSGGSSGGSTSGSGGSGGTSGGGSSVGTTSGGASSSTVTGTTYTVVRGDSLWKIAQRAGTTVDALVQLNKDKYPSLKTNPGYLQVGWILVVRNSATSGTENQTSPPAQSGTRISGRGYICNLSSVTIWLTVQEGSQWYVRPLVADGGHCSNLITEDVEALWGKTCDTQGKCEYQTWKLGDGAFWVTDDLLLPIQPGRTIKIDGAGANSGWSRDPQWPAPSLKAIEYQLRR